MNILQPPEEIDALTSAGAQVLHEDLRRGWHVKSVLAIQRQQRAAKLFQELRPLHNEALGQLTLVVDPVIYEEMRRQYGEDCWRDKGFRRDFAKDNPECGIRSVSRKTALRVDGLRMQGAKLQEPNSKGTGAARRSARGTHVCTP